MVKIDCEYDLCPPLTRWPCGGRSFLAAEIIYNNINNPLHGVFLNCVGKEVYRNSNAPLAYTQPTLLPPLPLSGPLLDPYVLVSGSSSSRLSQLCQVCSKLGSSSTPCYKVQCAWPKLKVVLLAFYGHLNMPLK